MKNVLNTTLFGAALLVAAAGFAQSSTSPQKGDEDRTPATSSTSSQTSSTDTNSTGNTSGSTSGSTTGATGTTGTTGATGSTYGSTSSSSTMSPRTISGTVQTYDAGKTLVVTTANGETQTFDLSNSPALASSVAVGSRVRVKQKVDSSGRTVVTVEPYR